MINCLIFYYNDQANSTIFYLDIQICSKSAIFSLIVPFFNPSKWAQSFEILHEKLTRLVIFALQVNTSIIVNIILPAIPEKIQFWVIFSMFERKSWLTLPGFDGEIVDQKEKFEALIPWQCLQFAQGIQIEFRQPSWFLLGWNLNEICVSERNGDQVNEGRKFLIKRLKFTEKAKMWKFESVFVVLVTFVGVWSDFRTNLLLFYPWANIKKICAKILK